MGAAALMSPACWPGAWELKASITVFMAGDKPRSLSLLSLALFLSDTVRK